MEPSGRRAAWGFGSLSGLNLSFSVAPSSAQCTAHSTKPFLKSHFSFDNLKMKIKKGTSPTGSKYTLNTVRCSLNFNCNRHQTQGSRLEQNGPSGPGMPGSPLEDRIEPGQWSESLLGREHWAELPTDSC